MPLNVVSPDATEFFFGRTTRPVNLHPAASLAELSEILECCLDDILSPATLDLLGHSTRDHHLLRLGSTPVNMLDPHVARFFRALADTHTLTRLNIVAVRLLGCETAVTDAGQRTLRMLSQTLRLPVYGTQKPLLRSHTNAAGFDPAFTHILTEASALT